MTDSKAPTIGERYGVAVGTGTQRDVILAAAMQRDVLGALLLRLQAEYDTVRGELERAGHIAPRREQERAALVEQGRELRAAAKEDAFVRDALLTRAEAITAEVEAIPKRTEAEIKSARAFILLGLKSLALTKQRIGAQAIAMATKRKLDTEVAFKLAGRVLDVYLDPACHHCDGTGVLGSRYRGASEQRCDPCNGTGSRRDILGNSLQETQLARDLYAELQRRAAHAAGGIREALQSDAQATLGPAAEAELQERLTDLRDPAAAVD